MDSKWIFDEPFLRIIGLVNKTIDSCHLDLIEAFDSRSFCRFEMIIIFLVVISSSSMLLRHEDQQRNTNVIQFARRKDQRIFFSTIISDWFLLREHLQHRVFKQTDRHRLERWTTNDFLSFVRNFPFIYSEQKRIFSTGSTSFKTTASHDCKIISFKCTFSPSFANGEFSLMFIERAMISPIKSFVWHPNKFLTLIVTGFSPIRLTFRKTT